MTFVPAEPSTPALLLHTYDDVIDQGAIVALLAPRMAESLDLATVLDVIANEVATLYGGVCQVRFTPAQRAADERRVIAGGSAPPGAAADEADHSYLALLERLTHSSRTVADRRRHAAGAVLLIAPLIARGQRIGMIDVVVPTQADAACGLDQRVLQMLAVHAALAIDTADRVARLQVASDHDQVSAPERDMAGLLSIIAHDLRGPLAALSSCVQMLARDIRHQNAQYTPMTRKMVEMAEAAVAQIEAQVNGLTARPGLAAVAATPVSEWIDLVAVTRLMSNFYEQTSERHTIRVYADAAPIAGPWERAHLERILGNLLMNSIKYCPEGGEIAVQVARLDDAERSWAMLSVRNPGIGIPACDLPNLMQPGFRARNVGSIPGTGFGLTSVREVVLHYGGTLMLESAVDGQTTIQVRLPLLNP